MDFGPRVRIEYHNDNSLALVTLSDPPRRNAMTAAMGDELRAAFEEVERNDEIRAIVLTGSPPVFSGGGDIKMLEGLTTSVNTEEDQSAAEQFMREFYARFLVVRDARVPVIAAVNGHAIGAGFCVALACDMVIIADEARVGANFARVGIHPGMGGSWLLPALAGIQRAKELLYTGRIIEGSTAVTYGLALEAVPAAAVVHRALELGAQVAASSPMVVRQLKANLAGVGTRELERQLDLEAAAQASNYGTDDAREGLAAIRERRNPQFSGRPPTR